MAVSTLAVCTFLGVIALIQHYRNAPEDSARIEKDVTAQIRSDEKRRALDAEFEAERQAKLRPTPIPEETLTPNTWKPEAPGELVVITPEPETPTIQPTVTELTDKDYEAKANIESKQIQSVTIRDALGRPTNRVEFQVHYFSDSIFQANNYQLKLGKYSLEKARKVCMKEASVYFSENFTCMKGPKVIFYYKNFPWKEYQESGTDYSNHKPTWINSKEIVNPAL